MKNRNNIDRYGTNRVSQKKRYIFCQSVAQSRCDGDLDHISIRPGLTKRVTLFLGHPVGADFRGMLLQKLFKICLKWFLCHIADLMGAFNGIWKHKNSKKKYLSFSSNKMFVACCS